MRILIAEDDFTSRLALSAMLQKCGHEVIEAVNGVEALAELQKPDAPRIALLDWMMPDMDGLEVVSRVRAHESELSRTPDISFHRLYLIILTARNERDDMITGLNSGADDYLAKPYHMDLLQARVDAGQRIIRMQEQLIERLNALRLAQEHIKTLQGILPICMHCKNIRNDSGYWDRIEDYISDNTEAMFSHSICPDCMNKHYAEPQQDGTVSCSTC